MLSTYCGRLAARAEDWSWSSVRAHLAGDDDGLVLVRPIARRAPGRKPVAQADGQLTLI